MRPKEWAEKNGVTVQTVQRWCNAGKMPEGVETVKVNRSVWEIYDPRYENIPNETRTIAYARVSTGGQKEDLDRQVERLKAFGLSANIKNLEIYKEIASGMNEDRKILNKILQDKTITTIIVEHRERLSRINFKLIESALKAQGREIIVIDDNEIKDDIVRDITEVMTSFCARFYSRRGAKNRAERALKVLQEEE